MKKYFYPIIFGILIGALMCKIIFTQYNVKMTSLEYKKAYFFEVGQFNNIDKLNSEMSKYSSYIYIKKDNLYYAYIGITLDNYEKLQSYFDKLGYKTKVVELSVNDKFLSKLKDYDLKLKNTDNSLDIKNIINDILKTYEEESHG